MSFDLTVFCADRPQGVTDARCFLDDLDARDAQIMDELAAGSALPRYRPDPPLDALYDELTERYPDLDNIADEDLGRSPWSIGLLGPWSDHLDLTMGGAWVQAVSTFVVGLAEKHGVCVYDPQADIVYSPTALTGRCPATVTSPLLFAAQHATALLLRDVVRSIAERSGPFFNVAFSDNVYMQALWTERGWLLEHREGSAEQHYRAEQLSEQAVEGAVLAYIRKADETWRDLPFTRVTT